MLPVAAKILDMEFEVTGAMGIKRKYQTRSYAQMVCRVKNPEAPIGKRRMSCSVVHAI